MRRREAEYVRHQSEELAVAATIDAERAEARKMRALAQRDSQLAQVEQMKATILRERVRKATRAHRKREMHARHTRMARHACWPGACSALPACSLIGGVARRSLGTQAEDKREGELVKLAAQEEMELNRTKALAATARSVAAAKATAAANQQACGRRLEQQLSLEHQLLSPGVQGRSASDGGLPAVAGAAPETRRMCAQERRS